jgi:ribosomal protein S27E
MTTLKEKKALLKKLENAYTTCMDCGQTYGVYSVGCSSVWNGTCNVCGEEKRITETRDFGYFITGIRKLKLEIQNEKSNRKTKKQQSQEQVG